MIKKNSHHGRDTDIVPIVTKWCRTELIELTWMRFLMKYAPISSYSYIASCIRIYDYIKYNAGFQSRTG